MLVSQNLNYHATMLIEVIGEGINKKVSRWGSRPHLGLPALCALFEALLSECATYSAKLSPGQTGWSSVG